MYYSWFAHFHEQPEKGLPKVDFFQLLPLKLESRSVEIMVDQERLFKNNYQLHIGQEYLEDSGGEHYS